MLCYNACMDTVRVKAYAKINLTLSVTGVKDGYHMLDSIVTSVDLYDAVKVKKRRDGLVSVNMRGCGSENIPFGSNNAVKAAQAFIERFSTRGADITVNKNIPVGAGLGGSSADAAGVLLALARLYDVHDTAGIKLIADSVGSDVRYMLSGGYARLFDRGNEVKPLESKLKLYFLLLVPKARISSAECYKAFDLRAVFGGDGDGAETALEAGDKTSFSGYVSNALTAAANGLCAEVGEAIEALKAFDPLAVNMTGSGSGVYAVFENAEFRDYAKSRYRGNAAVYALKTQL